MLVNGMCIIKPVKTPPTVPLGATAGFVTQQQSYGPDFCFGARQCQRNATVRFIDQTGKNCARYGQTRNRQIVRIGLRQLTCQSKTKQTDSLKLKNCTKKTKKGSVQKRSVTKFIKKIAVTFPKQALSKKLLKRSCKEDLSKTKHF